MPHNIKETLTSMLWLQKSTYWRKNEIIKENSSCFLFLIFKTFAFFFAFVKKCLHFYKITQEALLYINYSKGVLLLKFIYLEKSRNLSFDASISSSVSFEYNEHHQLRQILLRVIKAQTPVFIIGFRCATWIGVTDFVWMGHDSIAINSKHKPVSNFNLMN